MPPKMMMFTMRGYQPRTVNNNVNFVATPKPTINGLQAIINAPKTSCGSCGGH